MTSRLCVPLVLLLAAFACFLPLKASAQEASDTPQVRFTDRGRTMIGGEVGGLWSSDYESLDGPSYPKWQVWLRPSLVRFVRDGVGVGGFLSASRSSSEFTDTTTLGGGFLSVFEVEMGPRVGWLINSSLSYQRYTRHVESPFTNVNGLQIPNGPAPYDYRSNVIRLAVSLPIVFHVSESVGIGIGPDLWFDYDVKRETVRKNSPFGSGESGQSDSLQVGLSSWIGFSF